jgi:hypothetical protein
MKANERALRLKLKSDFIHYARKCLKLRSKEGVIAPFALNAAQLHIHAEIERQRRETGRVRALILKGRQQGCSTYVEGRFYWRLTHQRGAKAFILTHLEEASRNIYGILRRFHDNCPGLMRPHASHSNSRALVFDRLDCSYQVGTARSAGARGKNTLPRRCAHSRGMNACSVVDDANSTSAVKVRGPLGVLPVSVTFALPGAR